MTDDKNINAEDDSEEIVIFDDRGEINTFFRKKNLTANYQISKKDLWQRLSHCQFYFSKEKLLEVFPELNHQENSEEILTFTRGELLTRFNTIRLGVKDLFDYFEDFKPSWEEFRDG